MNLKLIEKKQETSDVTTFVFEPQEPLSWVAGQFLHYVLPHENPDDRGPERWFTISSAPYEKNPQITTRFAGETSSTFKKALFGLQIGDTIEADTPEGDFVVEDTTQEMVFIAGGIGITPYRAILKQLEHEGQKPKVHLVYSNRNNEVVFRQELEALKAANPNFKITYVFSPQRIDKDSIPTLIPDLKNPLVYVSGPEPMVESLGNILKELGVPEEHIKQDFFPGYTAD